MSFGCWSAWWESCGQGILFTNIHTSVRGSPLRANSLRQKDNIHRVAQELQGILFHLNNFTELHKILVTDNKDSGVAVFKETVQSQAFIIFIERVRAFFAQGGPVALHLLGIPGFDDLAEKIGMNLHLVCDVFEVSECYDETCQVWGQSIRAGRESNIITIRKRWLNYLAANFDELPIFCLSYPYHPLLLRRSA